MRRAALVVWLASIFSLVGGHPPTVGDAPSGGVGPVLEAVELFAFVILGTFGFLIVRRQPNNTVAWLALVPGLVFPLEALISEVAGYGLTNWGPDHWVTLVAGWCALWVWIPGPYSVPFLLALYPDGRPASPRWRPLLWLLWTLVALTLLVSAFAPGPVDEELLAGLNNPLGIAAVTPIAEALAPIVFSAIPMASVDRRHFARRPLSTCRRGGTPADQVARLGRRRRRRFLCGDHPRRHPRAALHFDQHRVCHPDRHYLVRRCDAPRSVRDRPAHLSDAGLRRRGRDRRRDDLGG